MDYKTSRTITFHLSTWRDLATSIVRASIYYSLVTLFPYVSKRVWHIWNVLDLIFFFIVKRSERVLQLFP